MKKNSNSGRPSNQERNRMQKKGIVDRTEEGNAVEMVYDNPSIFGVIFSAGNRVCDRLINLIFLKDRAFVFGSSNNEENNKILVSFNCQNLISYYCKDNYYFSCECEKILKVINAKLSDDSFISFSISENVLTTLNIIFQDRYKKYKKIMSFPIEVSAPIDLTNYENQIANSLDYPLTFSLDWKYYKKLISSWKKIAPEEILIEKDENLCFKFGDVIKNTLILYEEKIDLNYTGDDIFAIKVGFKQLSQIALAEGLSNTLTICASENNVLISKAQIDEVIREKKTMLGTELGTVYFFTKI